MILDLLGPLALATAVVLVVMATVLAAVRPLIVNRRKSTRSPTDTEREELTSGVDGTHRVHLRISNRSTDAAAARARALGILPGHQYVFVADELLDQLSEAASRAIVAHEVGHHQSWHPLLRVILPSVALIGWPLAIVSDVPYALVGGAIALTLYLLLMCYIERQTEYLADEYAMKQVGYASTINALEHLAETRSDQQQTRLAGLLATRPSFAERIAHLKNLAEDDDNDES